MPSYQCVTNKNSTNTRCTKQTRNPNRLCHFHQNSPILYPPQVAIAYAEQPQLAMVLQSDPLINTPRTSISTNTELTELTQLSTISVDTNTNRVSNNTQLSTISVNTNTNCVSNNTQLSTISTPYCDQIDLQIPNQNKQIRYLQAIITLLIAYIIYTHIFTFIIITTTSLGIGYITKTKFPTILSYLDKIITTR